MYLVITITPTYTIISLFDSYDKNSLVDSTKYPAIYSYKEAMKKLKRKLSKYLDRHIDSALISITGIIDYNNVLTFSPYLFDYVGQNLINDLKPLMNFHLFFQQESTCYALSILDSISSDEPDYSIINVSESISGVYVIKKDDGYLLFSSNTGHMILVPDGRDCICGQRGCVEAYIGGKSLGDKFLLSRKKTGNLESIEESVDYLSSATINFLTAFDAKNLYFMGSFIRNVPYLRNKIAKKLKKNFKIGKMPNIFIENNGIKANISGGLKFLELKDNNINITHLP